MSELLCIDPGTRGVGAAIFDVKRRELSRATYIRNPLDGGRRLDAVLALANTVQQWADRGNPLWTVACEVPRSYNAAHHKGPQDDLIDLAMVSAACAALWKDCEVVTYYPSEWKGTLKAETCLERIVERLSALERDAIRLVGRIPLDDVPQSDSLDHNTLDAIGIGLFRLGRFAPARSFHRE